MMEDCLVTKQVTTVRLDHLYWLNERKEGRCFVESLSGPGSCLETTHDVRKHLKIILDKYAIKTIVDAPCGDFFWMRLVDLNKQDYLGVDILPDVITSLKQQYRHHENKQFKLLNIISETIPKADLVICRDFFFHINQSQALEVIKRFNDSGSRYLLTTTFPDQSPNKDTIPIDTYEYQPMNLALPPFCFPPAIYSFLESHPDNNGRWMGLYKLPILPIRQNGENKNIIAEKETKFIFQAEDIESFFDQLELKSGEGGISNQEASPIRCVLQYTPNGDLGNIQNSIAFQRMCKCKGISYRQTCNILDLQINNYDFLWSPLVEIDPKYIHKNVVIMYGPQFSVFLRSDLLQDKEEKSQQKSQEGKLVFYNVLSQWNIDVHKEFSEQEKNRSKYPLVAFPFSVNTEIFSPLPIQTQKKHRPLRCIIYYKNRQNQELANVEKLVNKYIESGLIKSYTILKHGSFMEMEYISELYNADFAIWIGCHESQGFALQQCLAMSIPILVWDVKTMFEEIDLGKIDHSPYYSRREGVGKEKKLIATSIPYWSDACGEVVFDFEALEARMSKFIEKLTLYKPREFVTENLSDKVCMERILTFVRIIRKETS